MTKEEIIKYVTSSPENTNPNVLREMLDELSNNGGGGGDSMVISLFENPDNEYYLSNYETKETVTLLDILSWVEQGKIVQYIEGVSTESGSQPYCNISYLFEAYREYSGTTPYVYFLGWYYNNYSNQSKITIFTGDSVNGLLTRVHND